jgi:hypothetical protein
MRTEVAGGMSRYALDFDRGRQAYAVSMILTLAQFSAWSAFFHHIIKKGALPFFMPLDSGGGVAPHLVNIMPGTYNVTRTGSTAMVVTYSAEAENPVYEMTAAEAGLLIDFHNTYPDSSTELLNRLAQFATVDSNVLAGI